MPSSTDGWRRAPSSAEAEVGALFDVSRTVARAALQMLSFEGLVRTERNRGAFVANPTPEEARQVFDSRRLIEPALAHRSGRAASARPTSPPSASSLEEEARLHEPSAAPAPAAPRSAPRAISTCCSPRSPATPSCTRFMEELVARSSLVIALYGRTGASSCGHNEHGDILAALERRDAREASRLLLHHIDHIEADLDLRVTEGMALRDAMASLRHLRKTSLTGPEAIHCRTDGTQPRRSPGTNWGNRNSPLFTDAKSLDITGSMVVLCAG